MNTIKSSITTYQFSKEDYSGESLKVIVDEVTGTFETDGWMKGTFHSPSDGIVVVSVEEYAHAPITVYRLDNEASEYWYAEDYDISRDGKSPFEAALKLASNIF